MHKSFISGRFEPAFLICGLWGLTAGILSAAATDDSLLSLMRQASQRPVSIVLLLWIAVLPFLIAAYAVSIKQWNILFAAVFLRFFGWSFCAAGCLRCFGTATWLIQPMLQFTDNLSLILFCLFCHTQKRKRRRVIIPVIIGTTLTVIVDICIVSPFLASVLSF